MRDYTDTLARVKGGTLGAIRGLEDRAAARRDGVGADQTRPSGKHGRVRIFRPGATGALALVATVAAAPTARPKAAKAPVGPTCMIRGCHAPAVDGWAVAFRTCSEHRNEI